MLVLTSPFPSHMRLTHRMSRHAYLPGKIEENKRQQNEKLETPKEKEKESKEGRGTEIRCLIAQKSSPVIGYQLNFAYSWSNTVSLLLTENYHHDGINSKLATCL